MMNLSEYKNVMFNPVIHDEIIAYINQEDANDELELISFLFNGLTL